MFEEAHLRKIEICARVISFSELYFSVSVKQHCKGGVERSLSDANFHECQQTAQNERGAVRAKRTDMKWEAICTVLGSVDMKLHQMLKSLLLGTRSKNSSA